MSEEIKTAVAGTALAPRLASGLATFEPQSLPEAIALANQFAKSELIPKPLQGKPADVLIIILTSKELGIGMMAGLRGIYVWDGKPVFSAQLAVALAIRRREICEYFRLIESTSKIATYETQRVGDAAPTRLSWTIEQAEKAKLLGRQGWVAYPEAMLRARCAMALARSVYPDVLGNCYDPDEIADMREERALNPAPPRASKDGPAPVSEAEVVNREEPQPEALALPPATGSIGETNANEAIAAVRAAADRAAAIKIFNTTPAPMRKAVLRAIREIWPE